MKYLLDTVAVIRYFSGIGKIGKKAKSIFDMKTDNENRLLISVVSLMEILYLSEKSRIPVNLKETLKQMKISPIYMVVHVGWVEVRNPTLKIRCWVSYLNPTYENE